jgi:two-component system, NarL family, nitrate/nitrite response regulator NarL
VNSRGEIVRVVVADDHPLYREALAHAVRSRPELELVAELETGREALAEIGRLAPDVAVLDVKMPDVSGTDVLSSLARTGCRTRVMLVSGYMESNLAYEAIAAGAAAFFSKTSGASEICDAILAVSRGQVVLPPDVQGGIAHEIQLRAAAERPAITDREREILAFTSRGESAKDVGARLGVSPGTVKSHLRHVYEKLGVSDRAAAVAEAMRRGILP